MWLPVAVAQPHHTLTRLAYSNIAVGMATGATMAAPYAEKFSDTFGSMTIGGIAGLAGTALFAPISSRNFVARKYAEQLDTPEGKAALLLEKEVQRLTGDENFSFTMADLRPDNPWLKGLQQGSAGAIALKKANENAMILYRALMKPCRW